MKRYLDEIPKSVSLGRIVVHNHIKPQTQIGLNGFRIWSQDADEEPMTIRCDCGWAPDLPEHYRVNRTRAAVRNYSGKRSVLPGDPSD